MLGSFFKITKISKLFTVEHFFHLIQPYYSQYKSYSTTNRHRFFSHSRLPKRISKNVDLKDKQEKWKFNVF